MKNYIICLALGIAIIFSGCSTFHEPTTTTTSTTLPANTFIGITLGDSSAEVISVLGQPEYIETDPDSIDYVYDSTARTVLFNLGTFEAIAVVSANFDDRLHGVGVGMGEEHFRAAFGDYDIIKTGDETYIWEYTRHNIFVVFSLATNNCMGLGIYDHTQMDIEPY